MCLELTSSSKPYSRNSKRSRTIFNDIGLKRTTESVSDDGRWRATKPTQWFKVIVPGEAPKHMVILGCSRLSHGIKLSYAPSNANDMPSVSGESLDDDSKLSLPSIIPANA